MSEPLVSIVLPTYTRAHMLPHAIRSVLAQTHRNLELIIVDDKSKDDTPEVVRGFNDPRIRYVRNDENLKLPRSLNRGFELARGEYVTWTSDDNLYAPRAIEQMLAVLESGDVDFVFADYFDFARHDPETGDPLEPRRISLPSKLRLDERNSVGACFLYTRAVHDAVGPYDPELFLVEDYDYFIRVERAGFRIRHLPEALYYFSRHDDSLYCARFAEVQAAGVLIRYKNELVDREGAAQECIGLLMRDPGALKSEFMRQSYAFLKKRSFTLTLAYGRVLRAYLERRAKPRLHRLLEEFSSRSISFGEAKNALKELLQGFATLEYRK